VSRRPGVRRNVPLRRRVSAALVAGVLVSGLLVGCTLADRPAGLDAAGLGALPAASLTFDTGAPGATAPSVRVLVADTPAARAQGLQGVAALADGEGMLFLFPDVPDGSVQAGFWMLDTLVPLDIAFVREGVVIGTATMVPCRFRPCPVTHPGASYDAAVEVPAGWLAANGVGPGATLRWHPVPE
jgi:uncharacterized membrane protein (UPF0127 family)